MPWTLASITPTKTPCSSRSMDLPPATRNSNGRLRRSGEPSATACRHETSRAIPRACSRTGSGFYRDKLHQNVAASFFPGQCQREQRFDRRRHHQRLRQLSGESVVFAPLYGIAVTVVSEGAGRGRGDVLTRLAAPATLACH